jgi:hypothetical protein
LSFCLQEKRSLSVSSGCWKPWKFERILLLQVFPTINHSRAQKGNTIEPRLHHQR